MTQTKKSAEFRANITRKSHEFEGKLTEGVRENAHFGTETGLKTLLNADFNVFCTCRFLLSRSQDALSVV